jgi:hypothetical protein
MPTFRAAWDLSREECLRVLADYGVEDDFAGESDDAVRGGLDSLVHEGQIDEADLGVASAPSASY